MLASFLITVAVIVGLVGSYKVTNWFLDHVLNEPELEFIPFVLVVALFCLAWFLVYILMDVGVVCP